MLKSLFEFPADVTLHALNSSLLEPTQRKDNT